MLRLLPVFDASEAYWQEMARLLFSTWAARTGRTLPHLPVTDLSACQLEDFWADDDLDHQRPDRRTFTMHTPLAAVDIVGFGAQLRDAGLRVRLRTTMYQVLNDALAITGLALAECHHEDRGDGALIVFPSSIDPALLLDPLVHHLAAMLRRENRYVGVHARLRLRVAIHHGHVIRDQHGIAGDTALELFRLLDARAFKNLFAERPDADVGLIVPEQLFTATAGGGGLINPDAYQELRITNKNTRLKAHVWLPPALEPRKIA